MLGVVVGRVGNGNGQDKLSAEFTPLEQDYLAVKLDKPADGVTCGAGWRPAPLVPRYPPTYRCQLHPLEESMRNELSRTAAICAVIVAGLAGTATAQQTHQQGTAEVAPT